MCYKVTHIEGNLSPTRPNQYWKFIVDVVFFQMHVELKHSSKVFQFLPRVQCVCGQQPLFGSTIWDRAHQAALPTSHKTPQDKNDDDEGDGDDDDEGDVDSRW